MLCSPVTNIPDTINLKEERCICHNFRHFSPWFVGFCFGPKVRLNVMAGFGGEELLI